MTRGWATDDQRHLLEAAIPAFLSHQKAHTLHEFWPTFHAKFLRQFPIRPSDAELASVSGNTEAALNLPEVLARRRERQKVHVIDFA